MGSELEGAVPVVGHHSDAVNSGGLILSQEIDGACNLLRSEDPVGHMQGLSVGLGSRVALHHGLRHLGGYPGRGHREDSDMVLSQLHGRPLGDHSQGALGRVVGDGLGVDQQAADGSNVDHHAAVLLPHKGSEGLHGLDGAQHIDLQRPPDVRSVQLHKVRPLSGDTGVVDQHVRTAEASAVTAASCWQSSSELQDRRFLVIICNLLESRTDTEHKCFVKRTTNNLHTNG